MNLTINNWIFIIIIIKISFSVINKNQKSRLFIGYNEEICWNYFSKEISLDQSDKQNLILCFNIQPYYHCIPKENEFTNDIAIGKNHYCVVNSSQFLDCYGEDEITRVNPHDFRNRKVKKISAGHWHTCAHSFSNRTSDSQSLNCWGQNSIGQIDVPEDIQSDLRDLVILESGPGTNCVQKRDLELICWGNENVTVLEIPEATKSKKIQYLKIGLNNTICTVAENIECWGKCNNGVCDVIQDDRINSNGAREMGIELDIGYDHSCLVVKGVLVCQGGNSDGQRDITGGSNLQVKSVATGAYSTCILRQTNQIKCQGLLTANLDNDAHTGDNVFPDRITNFASLVSAGDRHTCARLNGSLKCTGNNDFGQLDVPSKVISDSRVVDSNWDQSCAVLMKGSLGCWGFNLLGQTDQPAPLRGPYSSIVHDVAAGLSHACAVFTTYTSRSPTLVACWGGHNEHTELDAPVQLTNIAGVAVGEGFTCVWTESLVPKSTLCQGKNDMGQTNLPSNLAFKTVKVVSSGSAHSCAINQSRMVICWGSDFNGQLVRNADYILGIKMVEHIVARGYLTCVMERLNRVGLLSKVQCWGEDYYKAGREMRMMQGTFLQGISLGFQHQCLWSVHGQMQCEGENDWGQIDLNQQSVVH